MSTGARVRGRSVSGSELESLGKTAARLSDTSGLSLTEASVRTLEHEGLNAEQVRRVVEHANIHAVNSKYASMKGAHRIVHIDSGPADPLTVIDQLNATMTAPAAQLTALEYSAAPIKMAHPVPIEKVASGEDPDELQHTLDRAHTELVDMCWGLEFKMEQKLAELCARAKQAHWEGASLCDLAFAWSTIDPRMAKVAAGQLKNDIPWGVKTAGMRIASMHPVVEHFSDFSKVAHDYFRAVEARRNVEQKLAQVTAFLDGAFA